jgi:hypothetical protein
MHKVHTIQVSRGSGDIASIILNLILMLILTSCCNLNSMKLYLINQHLPHIHWQRAAQVREKLRPLSTKYVAVCYFDVRQRLLTDICYDMRVVGRLIT